jgi:hypothetical protein
MLSGIDVEALLEDPNAKETVFKKLDEVKLNKGSVTPKYVVITDHLATVQKINDMPKKELIELESLSKLYSNTLIKKDYYKEQVNNENKEITYLSAYKDEIPRAIKNLKEHEDNQRLVKRDLDYLEGEKGDIYYRNNRFKKALIFIKYFLIGLAVVAAIAAFILVTMASIYNYDIFLPALIMIVILLFFGLWIYIFRRYVVHELKKNSLLQKRLVSLMNKTKIKYVNNQQFIDYEYEKYRVNSSEMLQLRWENFQNNEKNKNKFRKVSNNITTLVQDIEGIFPSSTGIDSEFVIEYIDYFISKKSRKTLQGNLEQEKKQLKEEIEKLDREEHMLSELLKKIKTK